MLQKIRNALFGNKISGGNRPRFVYLHIPKTAGSAVKASIAAAAADHLFVSKPHKIAFENLSRAERAVETFVAVRRPIPWYLSSYNYKMHAPGGKGYDTMPDNSLANYLDDVVFARNGLDGVMKWNRPAEHKQHLVRMLRPYFESGAHEQIGFLTLNFLFYTTRKWRDVLATSDPVATLEKARDGLIEIRHVLRQESLSSDFAGMVGEIDTGMDLGQRVNAMPSNPYSNQLDAATIERIDYRDRFILSSFYDQEKT